MRQTVGTILTLVVFIVCIIVIVVSFVGMFHETSQTVVIGPHAPETWRYERELTSDGVISIKSPYGVTITQGDGVFVTASVPGEIPTGEKLPVFKSQFSASSDSRYHTSKTVEIYADQDTEVTFYWYPLAEKLLTIFVCLIATYILLRLFQVLFDM